MEHIKIGAKEILASSGSPRIKLLKLFDFLIGSIIAMAVKAREEKEFPLTAAVKKVLVIRPGGMGDAVFLIPILGKLKRDRPELKVDILCEKRNSSVFESQPQIHDRIYRYDTFKEFLEVFENSYDLIIDTEQWHYLSAVVAYSFKKRFTIGFATRPLRAKLFDLKVAYDIKAYELDNFKRLFAPLNTPVSDITNIDSSFIVSEKCLTQTKQKIPAKSISLFLGGSIPEKRLSLEQGLAIIRFIIAKGFCPVLLGGRDALELNREIEKNISGNRLLNFTAKTSLEESAALIKQSAAFVGTDSGLMHLACAVGTPVVAIFGPSRIEKWGPQGERHAVIAANAPCAPCANFGYTLPSCKETYICMAGIDTAKITSAIEKMLNRR